MRHIQILSPKMLSTALNWVGMPAAGLYLLSMFAFPWMVGDWQYVQSVWERWQGVNVGMLAFIASITALNTSTYSAHKQREREFQATKAFLPAALSELCGYFNESATVFSQAWQFRRDQNVQLDLPVLPEGYRQVFSECIKHAKPDVGNYLSRILVWLQIHDTRMRGVVEAINTGDYASSSRANLISYLYRLAELQALVNKLFDFARNMADFDPSPLVWNDFRNALGNMGHWPEEFYIGEQSNLEAFIKRRLEHGAG